MYVTLTSNQRDKFYWVCLKLMDDFYYCPGINEGEPSEGRAIKPTYHFAKRFLRLYCRYDGEYYGSGMDFTLEDFDNMDKVIDTIKKSEGIDDPYPWKKADSDDYWDEIKG